jgi:hypothetical protein
LRQQQTGIAIAPGQQVHDAHRVHRLQHARVGRGASGQLHQVDGFDRGIGLALIHLAVADEYRRAGIDGHEDTFLGWRFTRRCRCEGRGRRPVGSSRITRPR